MSSTTLPRPAAEADASLPFPPGTPASWVLETPAADPQTARAHFAAKLTVETDPSDVAGDLERGAGGFVVVDARSPDAYASGHVPGALSLPYRTITLQTTAQLSKDNAIVVYCWGPACNAAAKAAVRLASLGFRVKEMIGGIEYWEREGYAVERDVV
jgi:rhodanese-related sulfurtransferase